MKFSIKNFFSKCDQICWKLRICLLLQKKTLMESIIFCGVVIKKSNYRNLEKPGTSYIEKVVCTDNRKKPQNKPKKMMAKSKKTKQNWARAKNSGALVLRNLL